jgi:hypothetical protein
MPKRDFYHNDVRLSLENDGWVITADPITLEWEDALFYPDLGAERVIAAQKGLEKIAVEIKSFINPSFSQDFYEALGQYDNYFIALSELEPDRKVILAISNDAYEQFFNKKAVQRILEIKKIPVLVFDSDIKKIVKWIR